MKNIFDHNTTDERIGRLLGGALGSLPENGECPLPEEFAALSEAKITGDRRERLLLHLAGCDRCRKAYSMVCEIAKEGGLAAKNDIRWQARRLVPLAAAAGLILVIVSLPLLTHRERIVNESVSPFIQKSAAVEVEKAAPATQIAEDISQSTHMDIKLVTQQPKAPFSAKEKKESTPPSVPLSAPNLSMQAAQHSAQLPAKESSSANVAPRRVDEFEPHFIAALANKPAESPSGPLNFQRRVVIDKEQRMRLSRADAATSDKIKIEGIFKDLKLDSCGFPLQEINKVVVQWSSTPRRSGKVGVTDSGEGITGTPRVGGTNVEANISLEDGGVLTIDVQGTPLLHKNRGAKIPVGC